MLTAAIEKTVSMKCPHCAARIFAQPQEFIDLFRCPECRQSGFFVNAPITTELPKITDEVISLSPKIDEIKTPSPKISSSLLLSFKNWRFDFSRLTLPKISPTNLKLFFGGVIILVILTTLIISLSSPKTSEATIAAAVTTALIKHDAAMQLRDLNQRNHQQAVQITAQTLRVQKLEHEVQSLKNALANVKENPPRNETDEREQRYDWLREREQQLSISEKQCGEQSTLLHQERQRLRADSVAFTEKMRAENNLLLAREKTLRDHEEKFQTSMLENIRAVREAEAKITKERKPQIITVPAPPLVTETPAPSVVIIRESTSPTIIRERYIIPTPLYHPRTPLRYAPTYSLPRPLLPQTPIHKINQLPHQRIGQMPRRW